MDKGLRVTGDPELHQKIRDLIAYKGGGANPELGFEKRNEINLGFTGVLFNHQLTVDANVFKSEYYDQITRPSTQYASFYANFMPFENFDSNSYEGAELGLTYNKSINDFTFNFHYSIALCPRLLFAKQKRNKWLDRRTQKQVL